jgi:hypothetical protein
VLLIVEGGNVLVDSDALGLDATGVGGLPQPGSRFTQYITIKTRVTTTGSGLPQPGRDLTNDRVILSQVIFIDVAWSVEDLRGTLEATVLFDGARVFGGHVLIRGGTSSEWTMMGGLGGGG